MVAGPARVLCFAQPQYVLGPSAVDSLACFGEPSEAWFVLSQGGTPPLPIPWT